MTSRIVGARAEDAVTSSAARGLGALLQQMAPSAAVCSEDAETNNTIRKGGE